MPVGYREHSTVQLLQACGSTHYRAFIEYKCIQTAIHKSTALQTADCHSFKEEENAAVCNCKWSYNEQLKSTVLCKCSVGMWCAEATQRAGDQGTQWNIAATHSKNQPEKLIL